MRLVVGLTLSKLECRLVRDAVTGGQREIRMTAKTSFVRSGTEGRRRGQRSAAMLMAVSIGLSVGEFCFGGAAPAQSRALSTVGPAPAQGHAPRLIRAAPGHREC